MRVFSGGRERREVLGHVLRVVRHVRQPAVCARRALRRLQATGELHPQRRLQHRGR